jgi:hypothetical protein
VREIGKGQNRKRGANRGILDTKKRTVIIDDYDAIPLSGDTGSKNTVIFSGSPPPKDKDGAESESLNRITGEATLVAGRLMEVHGVCKPPQKLF